MRGPPVVLTNTLGRPVTNVISERGAVPMTVVNTLGEPVTLVAQGGEPVTLFNPNGTLWDYPFSLFSNNEQGAWYDPSDFSTLFQNSTGTTPVTAVEQPVRLMLDRSGRGNHATAPNDASRPVLRARYNLLTFSEQFDNAGWTKSGSSSVTANTVTAPDGTTTADTYTIGASGDNIYQTVTVSAATTYTASFWARRGTLDNANYSVQATVGTGGTFVAETSYYSSINSSTFARVTFTFTTPADCTQIRLYLHRGSTTTGTIFFWGAQLLTSADQTSTGGAYQRIAAATDYDTSNPVWRPYLAFDGSDDSFSTSSIDFSGTDEMTVFAGVTKLSDAAFAVLMETTTGSNANNGAVALFAPSSPTTDLLLWRSRGTAESNAITNSAIYSAPVTVVVTGTGDISGDVATLRINGAQVATSSTDQGTGNYANAALFIGRRNNTSAPFNGRLYSLAVLGRTATAAELSAMEAWVNGKTGAY